jgi:hypothetical protein
LILADSKRRRLPQSQSVEDDDAEATDDMHRDSQGFSISSSIVSPICQRSDSQAGPDMSSPPLVSPVPFSLSRRSGRHSISTPNSDLTARQSSASHDVDPMISIKDAPKSQLHMKPQPRMKPTCFKINDRSLSKEEKDKWSLLGEAVRMDYVQRGPDPPHLPLTENKPLFVNTKRSSSAISSRYHHPDMFGANAPKLNDPQMKLVPSNTIFNC